MTDDRNNSEEAYKKNKVLLEDELTNFIASSIISHHSFPYKISERLLHLFSPQPFNNLGHHYLINYSKLRLMIWDTLALLKNKVDEENKSSHEKVIKGWNLLFIMTTIFSIILTIILSIADPSSFQSSFILTVVALFALLPIRVLTESIHLFSRKLLVLSNDKQVSYAKKCEAISRKILQGTWEPYSSKQQITAWRKTISTNYGEGIIDNFKIPIVVIFDHQPFFTGFGTNTFNRSLVYTKPWHKTITEKEVVNKLKLNLEQILKKSKIESYKSGFLIAVQASSIKQESAWLNATGKPHLYCSLDSPHDYQQVDSDASARLYLAIQVLLPHYKTALSFFIRVRISGDTILCQLSMTQLIGIYSKSNILGALDYYSKLYRGDSEENTNKSEDKKHKAKSVNELRTYKLRFHRPSFALTSDEISEAQVFSALQDSPSNDFQKKYLSVKSNLWRGQYFPIHSLHKHFLDKAYETGFHNQEIYLHQNFLKQIILEEISRTFEEFDFNHIKGKPSKKELYNL
ncbi:MAG: hypothetical protein ACPGJS_04875 [Flammeovirgaceae bacterium]